MADFQFFRIATSVGRRYYRVDPDAPAGRQVRASQDGLWVPTQHETDEQFLAFTPYMGECQEVPVEWVPCHLCMVVEDTVTRIVKHEWDDALVIVPRPAPVCDGHLLVIPRRHVKDALEDPQLSAQMFFRATTYASEQGMGALNIATSRGKPASQTEPHLHIHLVPREFGDGIPFLWDHAGLIPNPEGVK